MADIPLSEMSDRLLSAAKELKIMGDKAEFVGCSAVEGRMKDRIHVEGKDTFEKPIGINTKRRGKYSKRWAKVRAMAGRQISRIDLQFFGDLIAGYKVGLNDDGHALGFKNDLQAIKAQGHEERYRTSIFVPSLSEVLHGISATSKVIREETARINKKYFSDQ